MRKWNKIHKWFFFLPKKIVNLKADVYPKSPFYDAYSELKITFFNKKKWTYKVDTFKTPMTKIVGTLDTAFIRIAYPHVSAIEVHYPDNWKSMIQEARARGWQTDDRW